MAVESERPESASEGTPLLTPAPDEQPLVEDEASASISFARGLAIVTFVGILIFIQGEAVVSADIPGSMGLTREHLSDSDQHVDDDNGPVCHCGGPGRVRRGVLVHFCIPRRQYRCTSPFSYCCCCEIGMSTID